jgi:hypothetical protein
MVFHSILAIDRILYVIHITSIIDIISKTFFLISL